MGLLSAMFGAKPPYGTPPFAMPHENTGGAELPTTPETMPAKHGLAGFIDRLAYPSNGLGQIGMALLAGGGGPLGNAASILLQEGLYRNQRAKPHYEHIGNSFGVVDDTTGKFTPTYTEPDKPAQPDDFTRQMIAAGIDPASDEGKSLLRQHVTNIADPVLDLTLPGNRSYVGPRSMLPQTLGLPSGTPTPVGKITPMDDPAPANTPPAGGAAGGILRKNNPGALRIPGSLAFQSFSSPQAGIDAQQGLLGRYMNRGLNNVQSIVETYAPRQSRGGDNTDAQVNNYIGYVSKRLGVNPGDTIPPAMLPALAQAMREFETGRRAD